MPWYKFRLDDNDIVQNQEPEWHPHDVAAVIAAAHATAELAQSTFFIEEPLVLVVRIDSGLQR
jgi:hypothetical protein